MESERWREIERLYYAALERAPDERAAFLAEACAGDESLRREVVSFIAASDRIGSFLEPPADAVAAAPLATAPPPSMIGQTLTHYRIVSLLGKGGMGEVYLGEDTKLGRKVAVKLLPARFTQDAQRVRRFEQEGRAASALNHPNIITIYEIGQVEHNCYIATEYIEGRTLRQQMAGGRLKLSEALDVAWQVASALAAAHAAGIVHRDIKPENVMVRPDGLVKVLDFGLAKLAEQTAPAPESRPEAMIDSQAPTEGRLSTESGLVLGTASYMSPEQARGQKVDARSDIFSLGIVLYEMLAGRAPFAGVNALDVIGAILNQEPAPLRQHLPDAPAELQRIVSQALRKDREQRYQRSKDLLLDLTELRRELERDPPTLAPAHLPVLPAPGRWRQQVLAASLALLVVMALGCWFAWREWRPQAEVKLPQAPGKKALVVLFFENRSATPELDWLREGLADMLIANFSRSPKLSVLSRQQLAVLLDRLGHRRAAQISLGEALEIGRKTQAEVIALGSFAQLGEQVRLDVQLHDARTGQLLVTESSIADTPAQVLTQVDLLSLKLASQLGAPPPAPNAQPGLSALTTDNLDAYRYYSLALEQAQMFHLAEAIALLEKAIALDPQFALAYARIGYIYVVKWQQHEKGKPYLARAFSMAERLSEKDKLFVTAWAAVADNDSDRAIAVYREIIARYPLETEAYE